MILRPHHLLCINFFVGEGYSEEFVINMSNIISKLKKDDPLIKFRSNNDCLCRACINNRNGHCNTEDKVISYDNIIVSLLNIDTSKEYKYSNINKEVIDKILSKIDLNDICKNCCWKDICYKIQKEKYLKNNKTNNL